jgi:hypothetical protein
MVKQREVGCSGVVMVPSNRRRGPQQYVAMLTGENQEPMMVPSGLGL